MESFEEWMKDKQNVKDAYDFAKKAHDGQYRKILKNGEKMDYFSHPLKVAELVYRLKNSKEIESLVIAALLHDVPEDTDYTLEDIKDKFGELVHSIVKELTNNPDEMGNLTKEKYLINKMLDMTNWGLVDKLCDRLHNISDLASCETSEEIKFAKYYIKQTRNILNELKDKRDLTSTQKVIAGMIEGNLDELSF